VIKRDLNLQGIGAKKTPALGIGMIGLGCIGEAHLDGILRMPYIFSNPPAKPVLVTACDLRKEKTVEVSERFGFKNCTSDWKDLLKNEAIQVVYNTAPNNMHLEPCIAAAEAGKHIVCEKPLGRDSKESKAIFKAAREAKIKHICNFIFRMTPALAFAKKMLDEKKLGKIISFSATRLIDHLLDPDSPFTWRLDKKISGSGVVGDLMSHIIDLARWLCGEPVSVQAVNKVFIKKRPRVEDKTLKSTVLVEDDALAILDFKNGATGYLAASGMRAGRKAVAEIEINGELGTIYWNFEEINKLQVYFNNKDMPQLCGFNNIDISGNVFPYIDKWYYPLARLGFLDLFMHTAYNIAGAVVNDTDPAASSATFEDGYKASVICDAILKSSETGKKESISY
jgi:predicted dehydrogenase